MTIAIAELLETLARREDLSRREADVAFGHLLAGELTPAQAGALLMGLRAKGETPEELAAAVGAALVQARLLPRRDAFPVIMDTCGTGGDHSCSFNCSTAVAISLAALGHPVAKHGNRSMTGACGSADVIEALGLPMPADPSEAADLLAEKGFVFLFAPHYHPAFRHIMPVRKELGIRTLFNLLGPLLNPARPTHQLIGVARPDLVPLVAETLLLSGATRAAVVCGHGGTETSRWDELTTFGPATIHWVDADDIVVTELDPQDFDFPPWKPEDVAIRTKEEGAQAMRDVLAGKGSPAMRDMCVLNLGVALHLVDEEASLGDCMDRARGALAMGLPARWLAERF